MKCSNLSKFTLLVLLFKIARPATANRIWKRAGEKLIDLNRTPSPENSIESNQRVDLNPDDVINSRDTSTVSMFHRIFKQYISFKYSFFKNRY